MRPLTKLCNNQLVNWTRQDGGSKAIQQCNFGWLWLMSWLFVITMSSYWSIRICWQFVVSWRSRESRMQQKSRWCSVIRSRQGMAKLRRHLSPHWQETSPSALLDFSTFALHYINFTKIVPHDWKKLRSIWKQVNSHYKECLSCFTTSGTHSSNFFDFCEGHLETYYLRWHLDARPDLTGTVVADLPEEVFMEISSRPSSTISSSTKRKK